MARKELTLEPRVITGKKTAQLRRQGILPGNIYGRNLPSVTVQVQTTEFVKTVRSSTKNEVIDLKIAGENVSRPAIVQRVERNALTGSLVHADFYQVSLREKMKADVPVVLIGTSDAVSTYNGVLTQQIDTVQIEALPLDIPTHIEVDVGVLTELDSSIHVGDLPIPGNVTLLTAAEVVVAHVTPPRVEAEEEAAEEAAAPEGAAAGEPATAGEPAEEAGEN